MNTPKPPTIEQTLQLARELSTTPAVQDNAITTDLFATAYRAAQRYLECEYALHCASLVEEPPVAVAFPVPLEDLRTHETLPSNLKIASTVVPGLVATWGSPSSTSPDSWLIHLPRDRYVKIHKDVMYPFLDCLKKIRYAEVLTPEGVAMDWGPQYDDEDYLMRTGLTLPSWL